MIEGNRQSVDRFRRRWPLSMYGNVVLVAVVFGLIAALAFLSN